MFYKNKSKDDLGDDKDGDKDDDMSQQFNNVINQIVKPSKLEENDFKMERPFRIQKHKDFIQNKKNDTFKPLSEVEEDLKDSPVRPKDEILTENDKNNDYIQNKQKLLDLELPVDSMPIPRAKLSVKEMRGRHPTNKQSISEKTFTPSSKKLEEITGSFEPTEPFRPSGSEIEPQEDKPSQNTLEKLLTEFEEFKTMQSQLFLEFLNEKKKLQDDSSRSDDDLIESLTRQKYQPISLENQTLLTTTTNEPTFSFDFDLQFKIQCKIVPKQK